MPTVALTTEQMQEADAQEAGDNTFARTVLKPKSPGLDYTCGCCGRHLVADKYTAYVADDLKMVLTAVCCGQASQWKLYLDMGGVLFKR